jgi:imidazolonepropionase-like amidohydrolase
MDLHQCYLIREQTAQSILFLYFTINNPTDLDQKWETIKAGKPDFLKTYLLFSEDYEKRKDDPAYFGLKGLNPILLPEIVRRAHKAGLRVSTHIETAADFHNAVAAGVDEINHMVGYSPDQKLIKSEGLSRYEIAVDDARRAAQKNIVVITTLGVTIGALSQDDENSPDATLRKAYKNLLIRNLQLLKEQNARLAIGSDHYRQTAAFEALRLHDLKVFDNLTLLKMWCEATAATIFPNRRIGHLKEGYEASFLVLGGSPVEDFLNTGKIEMRVKQGEILSL